MRSVTPRRTRKLGAEAILDEARAERLKAALRENLKRRKAQARARLEAGPDRKGKEAAADVPSAERSKPGDE